MKKTLSKTWLWIIFIFLAFVIGWIGKTVITQPNEFDRQDYEQTNYKILTSEEKNNAGFSPEDICARKGDYKYCGINALERFSDGYTKFQCFCYKERFANLELTTQEENI